MNAQREEHGSRASRPTLAFGVLGPLRVADGGSELALGGRRQRLVLALLLLHCGQAVSIDHLVDQIWATATPRTGTGPLRTYVWQLRRLLEPHSGDDLRGETQVLVSRDAGYLLDVDPSQVDSFHFEQRLHEARAAATQGRHRVALAHVDDALRLWRGASAFGDLGAEPPLRAEATRLDQLRLESQEMRAEILLALGDHARLATELGPLVTAHPHRERLWALLMVALYRSGRQVDALRCYQDARTTLVEGLGIEPGPELRDLEQAILRQDPSLRAHDDVAHRTEHPPRVRARCPQRPLRPAR